MAAPPVELLPAAEAIATNSRSGVGWFRGHGMGAADMPTLHNRLKAKRATPRL